MGLSLRNIVKKVGDVAAGVERQINPLDAGLSYKTKVAAPQNQQQSTLQQAYNSFVKPVAQVPVQFSENYANTFANLGNRLGGGQNQTIQQNMGGNSLLNKTLQFSGATGQNKQLAGDVGQIGLTAAAPLVSRVVEAPLAAGLSKFAPKVVTNLAPKVASNSLIAGTFNATSAAGSGANAGQTAKAFGQGAAVGGAFPVAGAVVRPVARAVKTYDAAQNQVGAVGKDVNKPNVPEVPKSPMQGAADEINNTLANIESKTGKNMAVTQPTQGAVGAAKPKATLKTPNVVSEDTFHQRLHANDSRVPNISPELANLQNRYETPLQSTPIDQVISQTTGVPKSQVTSERDIRQRNIEAEQMALNHLQNGGTRDEAASLFQKATGTTKKDALFQVQRVAREGKQSLNVSPETPNPLLKQFELPQAKPGEFKVGPANKLAVNNSIDLATERATAFENQLHPEDKANMTDFLQGTKDIQTVHDPGLVTQAVEAARNLFDTVHALGQNYGDTKHIQDFFPGYYERTPKQLAMDKLQAEQKMEEQFGTQTWNTMSADEKAKALEDYQPNIPHGEDVNYAGFHSKGKIYKNQQEAIAAGETPMHANPYDAMRRYATGAKLQLGDQAVIQATKSAEPVQSGTLHTVDLPGGGFVRVGEEGIKALENEGVRKPPGLVRKVAQGVNKSIVRTIVANPLFHGSNQEFNAVFQAAWRTPGFKPANMVRVIKNQMSLEDLDAVRQEYYAQPNSFSPTYGSTDYGFIAKGLQKAGIDPKHAEISPRAMANIEENIRLALYKTARDKGMAPADAIATINKTLGGPDLLGDMASSYGLFLHYFTTNAKLLGDIGVQAAHGNLMPLTGLAVGYAAWVAANKAWQAATGNPDASVRAPGVLGIGLQLAKAPGQLRRGQIPSVVTSHTSLLLTTGIEQATNRDLHKPLVGPQSRDNSLSGPSGTGRTQATLRNTLGPALTVQNVMGSKSSLPEALTGYATGLYTPHAKGYQAAPKISLLNSQNAKSGTGLAEQKKFFAAQDKAQGLVYGDNRAQAAYDNYLKRDKNAKGQTVLLGPEEAISAASGLAGNAKALQAVQILKRDGNASHDPMWDLPTEDLKAFLDYQATRKTDPELGVKKDLITFSNGQKLADFIAQRSKYYQDNQDAFKGNGAGPVPSPDSPAYPNISPETQTLLNSYDKITDPKIKSQFIKAHPEVGQAFSDLFDYNNKLGLAQGGQALKAYQQMTPDVQKAYEFYRSLPQHDGAKGGSKTRALWISAHPKEWAAITNALANSGLYEISKEGAKNMYQGETPSQTLLQNIYNVGQYDIGKSTDNRGNTTYGVGAAAVAKAKTGTGKSGTHSSSSRTKKSVRAYFYTNSYKYGTDKLKVATKKTAVDKSLIPPPLPKAKAFKLGRPVAVLAKSTVKNKPKASIRKSMI